MCTKWNWKITSENVIYKTLKNQRRLDVFWWHQIALTVLLAFIAASTLSIVIKFLHFALLLTIVYKMKNLKKSYVSHLII